MEVRFSGRVRDELPEAIRTQLEADLTKVFQEAERNRPPLSIYVPRTFSGHTPEFHIKVILAVEITYSDGYERHIVKIGLRRKVEPDYTGWQTCTKGRMVSSRIFASVRRFMLGDDRVAVLYRDGFTLFGPDGDEGSESQPKMLEEAVRWAVLDDRPDPLSVERALAHVFTDLGLWFYRGGSPQPEAAHTFYLGHLRQLPNDRPADDVLALWLNDPARMRLRRHAVWVLAGRDVPDADPVEKPARYLDPVDYVRWAMTTQKHLPGTLVGRSHGDLHARNVLVGIRREEVQYPAVFDYGDMSDRNVLAWDFAKLETELKVRLLPVVVRDETVSACLLERSRLRKPSQDQPVPKVRSENTDRADRLAAFLAFEELLDDLTKSILDGPDAERIVPLAPPPTGVQKLDRLAAILMRVRREAAKWLGFEVPRRQTAWKNELYFALGLYGLLNVRWDYSKPEQEAALVSAGVAIARMPSTPSLLMKTIAAGPSMSDYPSYRVPLAILYEMWKAKRYTEGCAFGEQVVLDVKTNAAAVVTSIEVRPEAYHAIPLLGQALLMETEVGHLHPVERVLEGLSEQAKEFEDYETLARIGRLFKDSGDRKWETESRNEIPHNTRPPSLQMFDKAFHVYAEAFDTTGDWYVGINAATLARLTGRVEKAVEYAKSVATICAGHHKLEKKDRYWLFATEGEAALILGDPAENFYREALAELSPGQWGLADSSYKQACRLWTVLGDRVEPVLSLFETSEVRDYLTPHFLGRHFPGDRP
jgi:hypothetical protein